MDYDSRVKNQKDAERYWEKNATYRAPAFGYYASDNNYYLLGENGSSVSNGSVVNSPDVAGTEPKRFNFEYWLSHLGNEGGDFYSNLGGAAPIEAYSNPFFRGDIDKMIDTEGYFGGMVNSLSRGRDWKDLMAYRVDIAALGDLANSAFGGEDAKSKDDTIVNVQFSFRYKYDPKLGYVTSKDTAAFFQVPKMPRTNKRYDYLGNSDIRRKIDSIDKKNK